MTSQVRPQRRLLYALAAFMLAIQAVALAGAIGWFGRPSPRVLVDPDLIVSDVGLPSWDDLRGGLRFPDRIVAVDGELLVARENEYPAMEWDRAIERASLAGHKSVRVRIASQEGEREVDLALLPLNPGAWWLWAGGLFLLGWAYLGAALIAIEVNPRGRLSRAFTKAAVVASLLLFTLFDYHTTRALVPLFDVAFAMVPMVFLGLALRLPDDIAIIERRPWLISVLDGIGALLALGLAGTHLLGGTPSILRVICSDLLGGSFIGLAVILIVRFAIAKGERREKLRVLLLATVPAHILVGLGILLAALRLAGSTELMCLTPVLTLTPLASVFAFIRHDLWGGRALLSRPVTRVVIALVTSVAATSFGAFLATMIGAPLGGALLASFIASSVATAAVLFSLRAGDRKLFPSRAEYKPTIEQLSQELNLISGPDEVARAVERTVLRWLPCEAVKMIVDLPQAAALSSVPPSDAMADSGDRPVAPSPTADELSLAVSFQEQKLATIHVGKKRGGALFTSEDLDLLRTIANQAALALAYARSYAELEERRRAEALAWRGEKDALVRTVAAEIAHDVRYPINYFRLMFRRGAVSATLDAEDVDTICDEVERLERLLGRLRHLTTPRSVARERLGVFDLARRAEMLLRDRLSGRLLDIDVDGLIALRCDRDQVTQVLVNLVSNALEAAGPEGQVGVQWQETGEGGRLTVWDTGRGFDNASDLFTPWFTTKANGTGLGLSIASRFIRGHGWSIDARRSGSRTEFVIEVPASDMTWLEPMAAE